MCRTLGPTLLVIMYGQLDGTSVSEQVKSQSKGKPVTKESMTCHLASYHYHMNIVYIAVKFFFTKGFYQELIIWALIILTLGFTHNKFSNEHVVHNTETGASISRYFYAKLMVIKIIQYSKILIVCGAAVKFLMGTASARDKRTTHIHFNRLQAKLTTRTVAPNDFGVTFLLNFALTTPVFPCGLVTRPHKTRYLLAVVSPCFFTFFLAR